MNCRAEATKRNTVDCMGTWHAGARPSSRMTLGEAHRSTFAAVAHSNCSHSWRVLFSTRQCRQIVSFGLASFFGTSRIQVAPPRQPSGRSKRSKR